MYLLELAGEDDRFARREAASRCSDVSALGTGLATARGIGDVETLAYTRRVSRLLATCRPEIEDAIVALEASSTDRSGTVAVRAVDVRGESGVDTQAAERRLGAILVDRGFDVDLDDPDHTLVAAFAETAALGWVVAESRRDYGTRKPTNRPFFQPGSMDPIDARALANIAGAKPDARILDPMCGTGGLLIEAGLSGASVVGVDAQRKMVEGTRRNLGAYLEAGAVLQGDATRLPFDGGFDGAVVDVPYGRQSKIAGRPLDELVEAMLSAVGDVTPRAVVVGDRDYDTVAEAAGWRVDSHFERRVHRSLVRHIHVLERR
ncbi:MAG: methyltransferase domain-containing protein [Natronomonas sp.]